VSAREQTTGVEQSVTVRPSHGLGEEEIERMLLDSIDHAEEDVAARLLREERVEVARIVNDATKQLAQNGSLLSEEETSAIAAQIQKMQLAAAGNDHRAIADARGQFEEIVKPFAERIMNAAITRAVSGHSVQEFEAVAP
jgi:molecular chaperone HscA